MATRLILLGGRIDEHVSHKDNKYWLSALNYYNYYQLKYSKLKSYPSITLLPVASDGRVSYSTVKSDPWSHNFQMHLMAGLHIVQLQYFWRNNPWSSLITYQSWPPGIKVLVCQETIWYMAENNKLISSIQCKFNTM